MLKKTLALLLVVAMLCSFAACASNNTTTAGTAGTTTGSGDPTTAPEVTDPSDPTDAPIDPTDAPIDPTDAPIDPTDAPTDPTDAPTDPTDAPIDPTDAPIDPTDAPTDPTDAPTDPTDAPTDPTDAPIDPTDGPEVPVDPWSAYEIITIAQALELCGEDGNVTDERYYIVGTITSIDNANYGAMTIADETGSIYVYGTYSADGEINYSAMEDKPYKGDTVLLHCILQNFKGSKEVKNARLIDFKRSEVVIDDSDYTAMTIEQARAADNDTLVKLSGVVARITYANGYIPNGFMLVDNTQSIYVYDSDVAQRVSIGNTVTVLGRRTSWVLDSEKDNASKFGYKGATQIDSAKLLETDGKTDGKFDTSWIKEWTVKEMLDNSPANDITTTIFKVNAYVKRVDGHGFINYYFCDLDLSEDTQSYVYTQCSGGDFEWLDAFDGKICTVYLTALNCKSQSSGCIYRFLPVLVEDNGFTWNMDDTAEFVVKYYGVTQFLASYGGDPALELKTSASSELLGFENATLRYTSSDESIISVKDGLMNCLASGTATITVTAEYNGKTYSADVTISVQIAEQIDAGTVADAIAAEIDETVTVRGVIVGSLVNKEGFYLMDDTGIIAVLTDSETMQTLQLGYEIVIKGTRAFDGKTATSTWGTTCIKDAEVLANYYGNHDLNTDSFITGLTLADFAALDVNEDHTTEVYVIKATVHYVENYYYTRYDLTTENGTISILLYCRNAGQYSFLKPYREMEVTLYIVPCNWSSKGTYSACVLAIVTEDGELVRNDVNFG